MIFDMIALLMYEPYIFNITREPYFESEGRLTPSSASDGRVTPLVEDATKVSKTGKTHGRKKELCHIVQLSIFKIILAQMSRTENLFNSFEFAAE